MNKLQKRIILWSGISIVLLILLGTDYDPSNRHGHFPIIPPQISIALGTCIAIFCLTLVLVRSGIRDVQGEEAGSRLKFRKRFRKNFKILVDKLSNIGQENQWLRIPLLVIMSSLGSIGGSALWRTVGFITTLEIVFGIFFSIFALALIILAFISLIMTFINKEGTGN